MHIHEKIRKAAVSDVPADCYASKARLWLFVLGIIVIGITVYVIVAFYGRRPICYAMGRKPPVQCPQGTIGSVQPIALTPCPYCAGYLDSQGRCNIKDCPIYSVNFGSTTGSQVVLEPVQITKLAVEAMDLPNRGGVILHAVYQGGVADQGGLREGDLIQSFNGRRVLDLEQFQIGVTKALKETIVDVYVLRNGGQVKLSVPVGEGEMQAAIVPVANTTANVPSGQRQKPVQVKELAVEVLDLPNRGGAILSAVYKGGIADKSGLKNGDMVKRFNGHSIKTVEQFQIAIAKAAPEAIVNIYVLRNGEMKKLSVMVGEGEMGGAVVPVVNTMRSGGRIL